MLFKPWLFCSKQAKRFEVCPSWDKSCIAFRLSKKIIGDAGYGDYYNHGLGHGVGIDIHELPNFNRSKNIIEVGSVITMEPGVYLPGVGGVRLEDYGVVTENGYEPFTKTPHDLHVIDC